MKVVVSCCRYRNDVSNHNYSSGALATRLELLFEEWPWLARKLRLSVCPSLIPSYLIWVWLFWNRENRPFSQ